jgi:ribosome-associated protein
MARKKKNEVNELGLADSVIEAIKEKKGQSIVKIDLNNLKHSVCDYFIICQAESTTQVNAIADEVERQAYIKHQVIPHHIEGRENAQWVLVDLFDVVVHVFQSEYRKFYNLEDLWSDGKITEIADTY